MMRDSLLGCAALALALCACSSSDSASSSPAPATDSGAAQDAPQSDTAEIPDAAGQESAAPEAQAEAEAAVEQDAAPDAPQDQGSAEAAAGSKKTGEFCTEAVECADNMNCVSGQYTPAHCNPNCTSNDDCAASAPNAKGQCQNGGSINFCLYFCGALGGGATCPGDLKCEGGVCT